MADCSQNTDPLKLVREGTCQDARSPQALDPSFVPVNERDVAHGIAFARDYAALLKYFIENDTASGTWAPFFTNDVSVLLAGAAIEDVDAYIRSTQAWFDYLNNRENRTKLAELRRQFGYLFAVIASLARQLDSLKQGLPADIALKGALQNLIQAQLAPALKRLIAYYQAGIVAAPVLIDPAAPDVRILRDPAISFDLILNPGTSPALSTDWSEGQDWAAYVSAIQPDASVFGPGTVFEQVNHATTHNLFRSVFDQFLKVFARVTAAAEVELQTSLNKRDTHEPHYALFLTFLKLLEYARTAGNGLTQRHLDFYFRRILGLKEKGAEPGHVHLLAELAKQVPSRQFPAGELFKAGKDSLGKDAYFANRGDFIANQAKVTAVHTLYRHADEKVNGSDAHDGRFFASPVSISDDGLGAPLTSPDGSWHPFFNKVYTDGVLTDVRMPRAEIGFAIASHYLLMAEGSRNFMLRIRVSEPGPDKDPRYLSGLIRCFLTTEKGWFENNAEVFAQFENTLYLIVSLSGADPPIVPYSPKVHGYSFQTDQPMLLVTLKQDDAVPYAYDEVKDLTIEEIKFGVVVEGMKTLAVSNDFGPIDAAKPFQPFGASPTTGSSLVLGSKEIFQKNLAWMSVHWNWMTQPATYPTSTTASTNATELPKVAIDVLSGGAWALTADTPKSLESSSFSITNDLDHTAQDAPDFTADEVYSTKSRSGFVRLRLTGGFGQDVYQQVLAEFLKAVKDKPPPGVPPVGPMAAELAVAYSTENLVLTLKASSPETAQEDFESRPAKFFHVTPFGTAEQHEFLSGKGVPIRVFPRFELTSENQTVSSEAELYIGITALVPPQNLSLLFQVSDGTANPLAPKPRPHVAWSYLRKNQWIDLAKTDVQDGTDELLNSGIVTISVPRDANKDNTRLEGGCYWIRAAVHERSDAVCRLQLLAAQALEAVFTDRGNSPSFAATPLPAGTISKLAQPDTAVKSVAQRFTSFGGRGAESSQAFYTRVTERLRHKNRAIELWDCERLILEAFPQIYQAKCLNHTRYEPSEDGAGIYRELAPGNVTIVTIPNLRVRNRRDPLKPYTSLGLLEEIKAYLAKRMSCFAQLHVRNPQFEEVRVSFSLRLRDGFDETYYSNELKRAITGFLSPWAFSGNGKPTFGGRVYKSVLINFVEEQPYVDYVTDFKVFQDIGGIAGSADLDEVHGSRAVSILVSAPASKHQIDVLTPAQDAPLDEQCACEA